MRQPFGSLGLTARAQLPVPEMASVQGPSPTLGLHRTQKAEGCIWMHAEAKHRVKLWQSGGLISKQSLGALHAKKRKGKPWQSNQTGHLSKVCAERVQHSVSTCQFTSRGEQTELLKSVPVVEPR